MIRSLKEGAIQKVDYVYSDRHQLVSSRYISLHFQWFLYKLGKFVLKVYSFSYQDNLTMWTIPVRNHEMFCHLLASFIMMSIINVFINVYIFSLLSFISLGSPRFSRFWNWFYKFAVLKTWEFSVNLQSYKQKS